MLAFILSPIGRSIAMAVAALLLVFGAIYVLEKRGAERLQARIDKATIEAFKRRQSVDNETQSLGDFDLCISLGGMHGQCEQLRGMAKDAPTK